MQKKTNEKIDPLTRIQEEIKEVVRREEEYRQLVTALTGTPTPGAGDAQEGHFESYHDANGNVGDYEQVEQTDQGVLVTAQPAAIQTATVTTAALLLPVDQSPSNTPSLASSVNSNKEESLDDQHSDDSGISASSRHIKHNNNLKSKLNNNNINNNNNNSEPPLKLNIMAAATRQEPRYKGPNCYNMTPEPPQQKLMTRTISTPQLGLVQQRRQMALQQGYKGVMQRFIASLGKMQPGAAAGGSPLSPTIAVNGSPGLKLNSRNALAFLEIGGPATMPTVSLSTASIERDSEGRPLRRGFVPVEQKIQRELQDLKSRETELKRQRKLTRQMKLSLDKLQLSTDDEADVEADVDDDEDSEVEHCYGPGKLRNAQSTMELDSPDAELGYKSAGMRSLNIGHTGSGGQLSAGGMRPAMSLAQLCDLTPEEAPSSHRLIAQWESLIKKNAENTVVEAVI